MSNTTRLRYTPITVGVNATVTFGSNMVGKFLAVTAGTITINSTDDFGNAVTILSAFPVTAGQVVSIDLYIGQQGGSITTAGGASGTLGV